MRLQEKVGFLVFLLFISLSFVSSATDTQEVDDVFKINEEIEYAKPCFNNGTYCSSSAECNYTIFKPDNSILIKNATATNSVEYHNISFGVTELGIYKVDMCCEDTGLTACETFYFDVTGSGFQDSIGFYVIVLVLSLGLVLVGFWMSDPIVTTLGSFGLYFLGLYILFNGIMGVKDLSITWGAGIIILGLAFYISVRSAHELIVGG